MEDPALEAFLTGGVGAPPMADPFADPFGAAGGGADGVVSCQVCQTQIDAATGEPLGPVGREASEAASQYIAGGEGTAGQAELGGVALL